MFDISTLAVADTGAIHLKGPDGAYLYHEGKPVRIHLYSPGSDAFAEVEDRQSARSIKRMEDNDGKMTLPPRDQRKADLAEDLATLTVMFENFEYKPAADKTGKDLYRTVYADKKLGFIVEQVRKALGDWGKFTTGSETN